MKLVGFHAGEQERCLGVPEAQRPWRRYPLIEWDWDYDDCKAAILRAGLPLPGKSACYFCPSSKLHEIRGLKTQYPELLSRALEIERRAMAGEGPAPRARCGLGRRLVWANVFRQQEMFESPADDCTTEACFT
jgi:hypothetical protein